MVSNITSVVVNDFEIISMRNLFTDLTSAESITFNNVSTEFTIDMHELFVNCKKLKKLDLSSFNTSELLVQPSSSNPSRLFINCFSLKEVKIGTNFGYTLNEGTWASENTGNQYRDGVILTNVNDTYTRSTLYWGVTNNTLKIFNNYFNASHSGTFDYLDENLYYGEPQNPHDPYIPWSSYASSVTSIEIGGENDIIKPVYMDSWFVGFQQVPSLDLTYLDTIL